MIKPADLLVEAQTLEKLASHSNETRRRTVVSRAYYAAYHRVLELAQAAGYVYRNDSLRPGRHENLIYWARTHPQKADLREAGALLDGMKGFRTAADYMLQDIVEYAEMADVLEKASYILDELLAEPEI